MYNKIFGGHLMRQAFELAWSNAVRYAKQRVNAISIDDIIFQRPVEIGTLLFLSSQVVFTKVRQKVFFCRAAQCAKRL